MKQSKLMEHIDCKLDGALCEDCPCYYEHRDYESGYIDGCDCGISDEKDDLYLHWFCFLPDCIKKLLEQVVLCWRYRRH